MNDDRIEKYNQEISEWISKQSFLYQLLKAPSLLNTGSAWGAYLTKLVIKFGGVALLLVLVFIGFKSVEHTGKSFHAAVMNRVQYSLQAGEIAMKPITGGIIVPVEVAEISAVGTRQSFFEAIRINGLELDMNSLIVGKGPYDVSKLHIAKLNAHLKTSQYDKEGFIYSPLFDKSWFYCQEIEVNSFDVEWGYSEKTKGMIERSTLALQRSESGGWTGSLKGGTLSYLWMKDLKLVSADIVLERDAFSLTNVILEKNGARIKLNLNGDQFGDDPAISGTGEITDCPTGDLFSKPYSDYVTGTVNAQFSFQGSPDRVGGVHFNFKPLPGAEPSRYRLTRSIPLIKAMSTLDNSLNYRSLWFQSSDWELECKDSQIIIKDSVLTSEGGDQNKLVMDFSVGFPDEEVINFLVESAKGDLTSLINRKSVSKKVLDLIDQKTAMSRVTGESAELDEDDYKKLLRTERHFNGAATLYLSENAFAERETIQAEYPLNNEGVREFKVNLSGPVEEVTQAFTQKLFKMSKGSF